MNPKPSQKSTPSKVPSQEKKIRRIFSKLDHGDSSVWFQRVMQYEDPIEALDACLGIGRIKPNDVLPESFFNVPNSTFLHVLMQPTSNSNLKIIPGMVRLLTEHKANVNAQDAWGNTPLFCAAMQGREYIKVIQHLIEKKADINTRCTDGNSALYMIIQNEVLESKDRDNLINLFLEHKANPNHYSDEKESPLINAVLLTGFNGVESLLRYHADVNYTMNVAIPKKQGFNAVVAAAYSAAGLKSKLEDPLEAKFKNQFQKQFEEKKEILKLLINHHADLYPVIDYYLMNFPYYLSYQGNPMSSNLINMMFYHKQEPSEQKFLKKVMSPLTKKTKTSKQSVEFISTNELKVEKELAVSFALIVEAKADLTQLDKKEGCSLLSYIFCHHQKSIDVFINQILIPAYNSELIDLDHQDAKSYTILMRLSENKSIQIQEKIIRIRSLLLSHANPNLLNDNEQTALELAAIHHNHEIASLLAPVTHIPVGKSLQLINVFNSYNHKEISEQLLRGRSLEFIQQTNELLNRMEAILNKFMPFFSEDDSDYFKMIIQHYEIIDLLAVLRGDQLEVLEKLETTVDKYEKILADLINPGKKTTKKIMDQVFYVDKTPERNLETIIGLIESISIKADLIRKLLKNWQVLTEVRSVSHEKQGVQIAEWLLAIVQNFSGNTGVSIDDDVSIAVSKLSSPGFMSSKYVNEVEVLSLTSDYRAAWENYNSQSQLLILKKLQEITECKSLDRDNLKNWKSSCLTMQNNKDLANQIDKLYLELTKLDTLIDNTVTCLQELTSNKPQKERKIPRWSPPSFSMEEPSKDEKKRKKKSTKPLVLYRSEKKEKSSTRLVSYQQPSNQVFFLTGHGTEYYRPRPKPDLLLTDFIPIPLAHSDIKDIVGLLTTLLSHSMTESTTWPIDLSMIIAKRNAICLLCCWLAESILRRQTSLPLLGDVAKSFADVRNSFYHRFCNNFTVCRKQFRKIINELMQLEATAMIMANIGNNLLSSNPVETNPLLMNLFYQRLHYSLAEDEIHHPKEQEYFASSLADSELYQDNLHIASATFIMSLTGRKQGVAERLVANVIRHSPNYDEAKMSGDKLGRPDKSLVLSAYRPMLTCTSSEEKSREKEATKTTASSSLPLPPGITHSTFSI